VNRAFHGEEESSVTVQGIVRPMIFRISEDASLQEVMLKIAAFQVGFKFLPVGLDSGNSAMTTLRHCRSCFAAVFCRVIQAVPV
jgi:hypothetical protein